MLQVNIGQRRHKLAVCFLLFGLSDMKFESLLKCKISTWFFVPSIVFISRVCGLKTTKFRPLHLKGSRSMAIWTHKELIQHQLKKNIFKNTIEEESEPIVR